MAKRDSKPQHVEPEDESQELPEPAPKAAPKSNPQPTVSKAEAVRQALAAGKVSPPDGTGYIKSHYGIDMRSQMFSSYKAQQKARDAKKSGGTQGKPGRKPKAASQAVQGYLAPPPKPRANGEGDLIESLETLKPLIAQYGADKVKRLVDLLG